MVQLSNNIIQKGLAFIGDWSGTVVKSGPLERQESCPTGLLAEVGLRCAAHAAMNRMGDSDAKVFKEGVRPNLQRHVR